MFNYAKNWQLLTFAVNNAATNMLYIVINFFLMLYLAEIFEISVALTGIIMTFTRLLDAFTDPIIGVMVDKTNSKFGRFSPWIIIGSIISNLSFFLIFAGIDIGTKVGDIAFIIIMYIFWVIGYTCQTTITKSAQTILTNEPNQRTKLNAISAIYTSVIYIFVIASLFPLLDLFGGKSSPSAWRMIAIIFIVIQFMLSIIALIGIWDKDINTKYLIGKDEKPKYSDYYGLFKNNKVLKMLILAASTNKFASTVISGLTVYLYAYVFRNIGWQTKIPTTEIVFSSLATVATLFLTNKLGRKKSFSIVSSIASIYCIIAILIIMNNSTNLILAIFVLGINTFFMYSTDLNIIPMIADSVDYENYINNRFIPAMVGTAFSFIDKIISSFGSTVVGVALTLMGFVSLSETSPTPKLFYGVLLMYFLLPAFGHIASVIAMHKYPITKEFYIEMTKELNQRNSKEITDMQKS